MDFRQLEYFTAVARLRSFTRAAEALHVSQPTITTCIKKHGGGVGDSASGAG